jgi:DNA-binding NtrC family response regulator
MPPPKRQRQEGISFMSIPKVLICDDEEGIRESLKLVLGDHYEMVTVDSGDMALEVLSHNKDIKVMLLDIKMPKTHGLDILQEVKMKFPHVKIIMVTGYKSVETAAEATRLGANGYIVKPFKSQEILETVKKNMES